MKTLLLGDFCPTNFTAPLFERIEIKKLFTDALSIFENKDFVMVNLECALTESEGAIKKFGPALKAPVQTAQVLARLGVHCCNLSNNHVFDFGRQGIKDTLQALQAAGVEYTGFGENEKEARKNYVYQKDGESICVIAVCEKEYSYALENRMGSRAYDEYDTMEDIRLAKEKNDRVIVCYHGGKEFSRYPSPRLLKLCRAMVKNGADVVLCQHSHCVGAYEFFRGGHILYGQGNFHFVKASFSQNFPADMWNHSLAVEYDTKSHEICFVPLEVKECGIGKPDEQGAAAILQGLEERSHSLQDGTWKEGWRKFCLDNRENYLRCIARAACEDSTEQENAFFAHYLDCQAHTDVWRELFPTYNLTNEREAE